MIRRRGDNIPSVSEYAHWNEEAEIMWYQENKYDMEHADEIIEDDDDQYDAEPLEEKEFDNEIDAQKFANRFADAVVRSYPHLGCWYVEVWRK